MDGPEQSDVRNWLLRHLSSEAYTVLRPHLTHKATPKGAVVIEPNRPPPFGYFFESGLGSVILETSNGQAIEMGLFGLDGFGGIPILLESGHSPHRLEMQIGGSAWVIPGDRLASLVRSHAGLRAVLLRYVQFFLLQTAQTCFVNALRSLEERLARWLVMSQDRMDGDQVPLTHDYLSIMVGVSRTSVTLALGDLADAGLIRTGRGNITILDRSALEAIAGDSYGVPEGEYDRLIGQCFAERRLSIAR